MTDAATRRRPQLPTRTRCLGAVLAAVAFALAVTTTDRATAQATGSVPTAPVAVAIVPEIGATGPPVVSRFQAASDPAEDIEITLADPSLTTSDIEVTVNVGRPEAERARTVISLSGGGISATVETFAQGEWTRTGDAPASIIADNTIQVGRPVPPGSGDSIWIEVRRQGAGLDEIYTTPMFDAPGLFQADPQNGAVTDIGWIRDTLGAIRGHGTAEPAATVGRTERGVSIRTSNDRPDRVNDLRVAGIIDEIRFYNSDTPVLSLEADHDARRLLAFHPPDRHPLDYSGTPIDALSESLPSQTPSTWVDATGPSAAQGSNGEAFVLALDEEGAEVEISDDRIRALLGSDISEDTKVSVRRVLRLEGGSTLTVEGLAAPFTVDGAPTAPGGGATDQAADPSPADSSTNWLPTMLGALFAVIVTAGIVRFITNTAWWETRRAEPAVRRPGQGRRNH